MVDDEGVGGDFDGGEAKSKRFDVPMGERVGVVRGGGACRPVGFGVVHRVDDEVVAARKAGVIQDGAASILMGRNRAKSAMEAP